MISTGNNNSTLTHSTIAYFYCSFESWFDFSNDDCTSQIVSQEKEHHILSMLHQVNYISFFRHIYYCLLVDTLTIFTPKTEDRCRV